MTSADEPLNLLVAYPYASKRLLAEVARNASRIRLLVDSGAYTAWKSGNAIALDAYCHFIESLPVEPWRYFTLDVIGDPGETRRNYEIMLKRGFRPVPIFTRGEDWSVLEEYFSASDYVGLGGLLNGDESRDWYVDQAVKRAGDRKVHLLGYTGMDRLKQWRPYTCDSSSWRSAERYGTAYIYMGFGKFKTLGKHKAAHQPEHKLLDRIRQLGFSAAELRKFENWHDGSCLSQLLNATSWVAASLDVRRNLGTLLFLAAATDNSVLQLVHAHERLVP